MSHLIKATTIEFELHNGPCIVSYYWYVSISQHTHVYTHALITICFVFDLMNTLSVEKRDTSVKKDGLYKRKRVKTRTVIKEESTKVGKLQGCVPCSHPHGRRASLLLSSRSRYRAHDAHCHRHTTVPANSSLTYIEYDLLTISRMKSLKIHKLINVTTY